jgi:hypothetical protein
MDRPKRSIAIKRFLEASTYSDLHTLYNDELEVQVLVDKGDGERYEGDYKGKMWQGYSNGIEIWKSFRIPLDANSE